MRSTQVLLLIAAVFATRAQDLFVNMAFADTCGSPQAAYLAIKAGVCMRQGSEGVAQNAGGGSVDNLFQCSPTAPPLMTRYVEVTDTPTCDSGGKGTTPVGGCAPLSTIYAGLPVTAGCNDSITPPTSSTGYVGYYFYDGDSCGGSPIAAAFYPKDSCVRNLADDGGTAAGGNGYVIYTNNGATRMVCSDLTCKTCVAPTVHPSLPSGCETNTAIGAPWFGGSVVYSASGAVPTGGSVAGVFFSILAILGTTITLGAWYFFRGRKANVVPTTRAPGARDDSLKGAALGFCCCPSGICIMAMQSTNARVRTGWAVGASVSMFFTGLLFMLLSRRLLSTTDDILWAMGVFYLMGGQMLLYGGWRYSKRVGAAVDPKTAARGGAGAAGADGGYEGVARQGGMGQGTSYIIYEDDPYTGTDSMRSGSLGYAPAYASAYKTNNTGTVNYEKG